MSAGQLGPRVYSSFFLLCTATVLKLTQGSDSSSVPQSSNSCINMIFSRDCILQKEGFSVYIDMHSSGSNIINHSIFLSPKLAVPIIRTCPSHANIRADILILFQVHI
jgi:hypothetical protein